MNLPVYILLVPVIAAVAGGLIGACLYKKNQRRKER